MDSVGLPWWFSGKGSACWYGNHGFNSWPWRIPHAVDQLSPWAATTKPCSRAAATEPTCCATEPASPAQPVLGNKRGHCKEEAECLNGRVDSTLHNWRKEPAQQRRPSTAENKVNFKIKLNIKSGQQWKQFFKVNSVMMWCKYTLCNYCLSILSVQLRALKHIHIVGQPSHHPSPVLSHLPKLKLCPHETLTPHPFPQPLDPPSTSCLCGSDSSRDLLWVGSDSICLLYLALFTEHHILKVHHVVAGVRISSLLKAE